MELTIVLLIFAFVGVLYSIYHLIRSVQDINASIENLLQASDANTSAIGSNNATFQAVKMVLDNIRGTLHVRKTLVDAQSIRIDRLLAYVDRDQRSNGPLVGQVKRKRTGTLSSYRPRKKYTGAVAGKGGEETDGDL